MTMSYDNRQTPRVIVKENIPGNACIGPIPKGAAGVIVPGFPSGSMMSGDPLPEGIVVVKFEGKTIGYPNKKYVYVGVKDTNLKPSQRGCQ
jgi:hypothetical protein